MKKKEKELTKKAKKQIRRSLEETLTEEIKKTITAQGRNPKKVAREIKKAASLIARKLADKESISQPAPGEKRPDTTDIKERVNSFDVPAIPPPALPVVPDPPTAETPLAETPTPKVRKTRRIAGEIAAQSEAVPVKQVRKSTTPTPAVPKEENPGNEVSENSENEELNADALADETKSE